MSIKNSNSQEQKSSDKKNNPVSEFEATRGQKPPKKPVPPIKK